MEPGGVLSWYLLTLTRYRNPDAWKGDDRSNVVTTHWGERWAELLMTSWPSSWSINQQCWVRCWSGFFFLEISTFPPQLSALWTKHNLKVQTSTSAYWFCVRQRKSHYSTCMCWRPHWDYFGTVVSDWLPRLGGFWILNLENSLKATKWINLVSYPFPSPAVGFLDTVT